MRMRRPLVLREAVYPLQQPFRRVIPLYEHYWRVAGAPHGNYLTRTSCVSRMKSGPFKFRRGMRVRPPALPGRACLRFRCGGRKGFTLSELG